MLSLAWNQMNVLKLPFWKDGVPKVAIVITDAGLFIGFLVLSIANGLVMSRFNRYGGSHDKIMMYTYNSVPWLICAYV